MGMYKKVLVAFDGSKSARNALKQVIKLTRSDTAWIKVISVMPEYEGELEFVGISDIKGVLEGPTRKLLDEAAGIASDEGAKIETGIEHGKIYEKIVDTAENENCDLIVMGRRGLTRLERVLMGSVTSRVIGNAHTDILVVPRDATLGWKRIFLAVDGSEFSKIAAARAIDFARSYGSEMTAISVVDVTDEFYAQAPDLVEQMIRRAKEILEDIKKRAEESGIRIETAVREGTTYQKVLELASEKGADMIFMGSHGRTGVKKMFMGSVTEKVIGHAQCPVMVVK